MTKQTVQILMAVYNGETHLPDQLNSLAAQSHEDWHLWASLDQPKDGPADASAQILDTFAQAHSVTRQPGPCRGAAQNFLSLCRSAPPDSFWAFCDQDDIWEPQKLATALAALRGADPAIPALYCGRSQVIEADGTPRGLSPLQTRPPSFANALVQNIAGGNTFVLNPAATNLVAQAALSIPDLVMHDWWVYQLVTGAGGQVIFDPTPQVRYRQHRGNVIGANDGWRARFARARLIFTGTWSGWIDTNIAALTATRDQLTSPHQAKLDLFSRARKSRNPLKRLYLLRKVGVYRQSRLAGVTMWLAALLGRL